MIGHWQRRRDAGRRDAERGGAVGLRMARVVQANGRMVHRCARATLAACFLLAAAGLAQAQARKERIAKPKIGSQLQQWVLKDGQFRAWCGDNYAAQVGKTIILYSPQGDRLAEFPRPWTTFFEGCDDSGKQIYFKDNDNGELVSVDIATKTTEVMLRFKKGDQGPLVFISPDRKHLAYVRLRMPGIVDNVANLTLIPIDEYRAAWSPDSSVYLTFEMIQVQKRKYKLQVKVNRVGSGTESEFALPPDQDYRSAFVDVQSGKVLIRVSLDDITGDGKIYYCDMMRGKCVSDGRNYGGLSMSRFGDVASVQKIFEKSTFAPLTGDDSEPLPDKYVVKVVSRHRKTVWSSEYFPLQSYHVEARLSPSGKYLAIDWSSDSSRCAGWVMESGICREGIVVELGAAANGKNK